MDKKTIIKLILTCILTAVLFNGSLIIGCFWGEVGMFVGLFVGVIMIFLVTIFCLPRWFKDYIEYYWQKQEEKKCQEKEVDMF